MWKDMSVLLVSFLFPTRTGPCPKTLTSTLQEIHVHHLSPVSKLFFWLFKQLHPYKKEEIAASNYNTTAMRSFLVHPLYPKAC